MPPLKYPINHEQRQIILNNYAAKGGVETYALLKATGWEGSIELMRGHAIRMGLRTGRRPVAWTEERDGLIRELYPTGGSKAVIRAMKDSSFVPSPLAVNRRAVRLGVKSIIKSGRLRGARTERRLLKGLRAYGDMELSLGEIADGMGMSYEHTRSRLRKLESEGKVVSRRDETSASRRKLWRIR